MFESIATHKERIDAIQKAIELGNENTTAWERAFINDVYRYAACSPEQMMIIFKIERKVYE